MPKHYGPEPPWRGDSPRYGSFRRVEPGPDDWLDTEPYWVWVPPAESLLTWMLKKLYAGPTARRFLDEPILARWWS